MAIETWFPLAIYTEDLPDAADHQAALVGAVLQLERDGAERQAYPDMAWTGDLHGVSAVHADRRFRWITGQIEAHTVLYLEAMGLDLSQVDLYIQRAWPIVARTEQEVGPHCHNTAHISAVYYIAVPLDPDCDPGSLVFFDDARVNEVSPGLGSQHTDIINEWNALNQMQVAYPPQAGRVVIFPAKQRHGVTANESAELRISLSFDIVLTAKSGAAGGTYEFLTPPPHQWQPFQAASTPRHG
jgi:uncharacterized protein (TIGR02466 family)